MPGSSRQGRNGYVETQFFSKGRFLHKFGCVQVGDVGLSGLDLLPVKANGFRPVNVEPLACTSHHIRKRDSIIFITKKMQVRRKIRLFFSHPYISPPYCS